MLSVAWEFTKRHKGKIITGGAIIGSAIAAYTVSNQDHYRKEQPHVQSELPDQARRHYIFDSTHRSCDQSITELIPSIISQIEARFDIQTLKDALNSDVPLTKEQKLFYWDQLKINVFSRIIAVAYGFSILTLTLKAQISILAADTCSQFHKPEQQSYWKEYLPAWITGETAKSSTPGAVDSMEVGNRRIFLQCIQYFTLKGIPQLMDSIADAVNEEMKDWSLQAILSKENTREIFDKVGTRLGHHGLLTKLVAPLDENTDDGNSSVVKLLQKLTSNLESEKCISTLNSLIDFYFFAAIKMIEDDEQPVVKYIPSFTNAYTTLTSTAFDSPLFNSLYSSDIHQFSVYVFNS